MQSGILSIDNNIVKIQSMVAQNYKPCSHEVEARGLSWHSGKPMSKTNKNVLENAEKALCTSASSIIQYLILYIKISKHTHLNM